jgi:hypothetical protein
MSNVSLYILRNEYAHLLQKLSEGDFDPTTIADTVEASGITDAIAEKAQGYEMVARTLEMHGPAIDVEIERLSALKKQRQRAAQSLRDYLKQTMQGLGITKLESPLFAMRLQNNPPSVDVFEIGTVPAAYFTQPETPPPVLNKKLIAADIKAGIEVPGAKLVVGQSLRVS